MAETNIYQKLQQVRCAVNKECTKKTGKNQYFSYFQLEDFLGVANNEFNKVGLCPIFNIEYLNIPVTEFVQDGVTTKQNDIREIATLSITDGKDVVRFTAPSAQAKLNSQNPIQERGAQITYLKRYLYMNALELSEGDIVDASHTEKKEKNNKATESQVAIIKELAPTKKAFVTNFMNKHKLTAYADLTVEQASELVKALKDE